MTDVTRKSDANQPKQLLLDEIASLRKQLVALGAATRAQDYDSLFAQFPLGMQEEDYSNVKIVIDDLKARGVVDIREYLENDPKLVLKLMKSTKVTRVNRAMLTITHDATTQEFLDGEVDVESWWNDKWARYCAAEFAALASPEMVYEDESEDTRSDGSIFKIRTIATVVTGYENTWQKVITIFEDITERKATEKALIEAKLAADESNRAKSDFLSSMSHELRTPLNAILGFAELIMCDASIAEKHLSSAREIGRAGEHLLRLIDEILDLSRIESGEIGISIEPVPVMEVMDECLTWVTDMARNNGISIHYEPRRLEGLVVLADKIRLKQAVLNLLTNAIKYNSPAGQIRIICDRAKDGFLRFGIRDYGPGIPQDQIHELFQPFRRLGAERSGVNGTGIGLVITRKLVQRMQGRLELDSTLGEGSTFWIALPQSGRLESDRSASAIDSRINATDVTESATGPSILVVEDNPINRDLIAAQMEHLKYKADMAGDGAEAIELWRRREYDLLITDIRMAGMDGYELIEEIRSAERPGSESKPIIVLSANVMGDEVKRCFEAGANDVLNKPVKISDLRASIQNWSGSGGCE